MALRGTDIIVVLDKSSSMEDVQEEIMRGFNLFLDEQRKNKETAAISLYQFSTGFEIIYEEMDLQKAPRLDYPNYQPYGQTALYDAVGKAISMSEFRLNRLPDRPGKVLLVVITDGEENASREYNQQMVEKLVEDFKLKWQFVFLGADQDAFDAGQAIGFDKDAIMNFRSIGGSIGKAFKSLSASAGRYRDLEIEEQKKGNYFLPGEQDA